MQSMFHMLYWEATRRCNFACAGCASGSDKKDATWRPELTAGQAIERLFKPAWDLGSRFLAFSGGEFLLRQDAFELLDVANRMGFRIMLLSNGSTLTDFNLAKLKSLLGRNLKISLGINSIEDDANLASRDTTATSILSVLDRLKAAKISCNVTVTVGRHTAEGLHATLAYLHERRVTVNRGPFTPRQGTGHNLMMDRQLNRDVLHPILRRHYEAYVSFTPILVSPKTYERICGQTEAMTPVPTNPSLGCWVGSFYCVTPEGDVAPCSMLADHFCGGNVVTDDLRTILYESDIFRKLVDRPHFKGRCGDCEYRFTCGGCRAMAYHHTGDVFAEDPTCFIDELSEDERRALQTEMEGNFEKYVQLCKHGRSHTRPPTP